MFTSASSLRRDFIPTVVTIGPVSLQEAQREQKAMITQTVCQKLLSVHKHK